MLLCLFLSARYRGKPNASEAQQTQSYSLVLQPKHYRLLHIMAQDILAFTMGHKLLYR